MSVALRRALVAGEIAVRAYVTEAGEDKRLPRLRALRSAVLEQQPARARQVHGCAADDRAKAREPIRTRGERGPRLVREARRRHGRIVRGDVGRVADNEIEALARERLVPVPLAE